MVFHKQKTKLNLLTNLLEHQLSAERVVEAVGKLATVPDEELRVGANRANSVEINCFPHLTSDQILRARRVGRVDVAHPIRLVGVGAVHVVVLGGAGVDAPEVLARRLLRHAIPGIHLPNQGTKACASGYVIGAPNTKNLREKGKKWLGLGNNFGFWFYIYKKNVN